MSLIQRSLHVYMFLCVFVCVCVCSHSMIWEAHDIMDLWCVCLHHVSRDGILVWETIWFSEKHRRFWNLRQDLRLNLVLMASEHALSSSFTFYTIRKEMATHSSILAWRIPWTEELGRLQSTGSQRVGYEWVTSLSLSCLTWRRKWQHTPVLLPGESHGQRSLAGHGPWGRRESDTTEVTKHACTHASLGQGDLLLIWPWPLCTEDWLKEGWLGYPGSLPSLNHSPLETWLKQSVLFWGHFSAFPWLCPPLSLVPKSEHLEAQVTCLCIHPVSTGSPSLLFLKWSRASIILK